MLVLVAFLFMMLAMVLNVIGRLMDDGLALIYASIGCSLTAALFIITAVRRAKADGPPDS